MAQHRPIARISEVAALAGVSTATVSRAFTAPEMLRPATLARVEEAVRRTGYTPHQPARMLRARRTMVVLVVVPDIGNPFFSDVLRGIEETLSDGGYGLLIGNLGPSRAKEAQIVEIVQAGQVDGVLLLNGHVPEAEGRSLIEAGIATVAVCEAIPGAPFPQVEVENRAAARAAVAHLVGLGHRRLGYMCGSAGEHPGTRAAHAGFCEGLEAGRVAGSARRNSGPAISASRPARRRRRASSQLGGRPPACSPPMTRWRSASSRPCGMRACPSRATSR